MKQLEMVYIMNVLQYFRNLNDIQQLNFVSKKCKEAIKATKINVLTNIHIIEKTKYIPKYLTWLNYKLLLNQINIFPNIQTITCHSKYLSPLLKYKKNIVFNVNPCHLCDLTHDSIPYIRSLTISLFSVYDFSMFSFHSLKLSFNGSNPFHLKKTLQSLPFDLKKLILVTSIFPEQFYFNELLPNCSIALLFRTQHLPQLYHHCNIIATKGLSDKYICYDKTPSIISTPTQHLLSQYLFTSVEIQLKEFKYDNDLMFCQELNLVSCSLNSLPLSLTELALNNMKIPNNLLQCTFLKTLVLNEVTSDPINLPRSLEMLIVTTTHSNSLKINNFKDLSITCLYLMSDFEPVFECFPVSIKELHITNYIINSSINQMHLTYLALIDCEVTSLTLPLTLKKLDIESTIFKTKSIIDESTKLEQLLLYDYDCLSQLQHLENIEIMEIGNFSDISTTDLSCCISLKDLILVSFFSDCIPNFTSSVTRFELETNNTLKFVDLSNSNIKNAYFGICNCLISIQLPSSINCLTLRSNELLKTIQMTNKLEYLNVSNCPNLTIPIDHVHEYFESEANKEY
ncbi:Leucine-rich repeat containing protein [Entamoeba marina]